MTTEALPRSAREESELSRAVHAEVAEVLHHPKPALTWRFAAVDGLRAFACLMVIVIHAWEFARQPQLLVSLHGTVIDLAWPVTTFPSAVDLFMVLSGFCLFFPMCKSPETLEKWSWKNYLYRRFRRICPPYYSAIALVILLPELLVIGTRLLGGEAKWQPFPTKFELVTHVFFIHTLFNSTWDRITGAFWTLGLEMQFYILFPIIIFAFRRIRIHALLAVIALSVIFRFAVSSYFQVGQHLQGDALLNAQRLYMISFLGLWMQFAIGMLTAMGVAYFYRRHQTLPGWVGTLIVVGAVYIYWLAWGSGIDQAAYPFSALPNLNVMLALVFALLIFALTTTSTFIRKVFEFKPLVFMGSISYSVFLVHQTIAWFVFQFLLKKLHIENSYAQWFLISTVGLAVIIAVAYPFYLLVEKPFITAPKKKMRKLETAGEPKVVTVPSST